MGGISGSVLVPLAAQIQVVLCARGVSADLKACAGGARNPARDFHWPDGLRGR